MILIEMTSIIKYLFLRSAKIRSGLRLLTVMWFCLFFAAGCKKLVEVPSPTTSLTSENVYTDDATAAAVLTGIYTNLSTRPILNGSILTAVSLVSGLSADELTLYGGANNANSVLVQYYLNNLSSGISTTINGANVIWTNTYTEIYILNLALERLSGSTSLTPAVKSQLTGEAKFMRAFFYFYLVNLYGDVPLAISSDYTVTSVLPRTPVLQVYRQIIADLRDAKALLTPGYVAADARSVTTERVRPSKWAAGALLARVYLYTKDYPAAETEADSVIGQSSLYGLGSLNLAFLRNSREAIWQLQPVNAGWNTQDAQVFILPATGPTGNYSQSGYPVYLSPKLLASFEAGDLRRLDWVDSVIVNGVTYHYPYKYKSATLGAALTEYTMVLRLGEQFLIRAEARAMNSNIQGAQSDLNVIRRRAGLGVTLAGDAVSLTNAILHERQTELFTEWGNRWLDLKRTGLVDEVMRLVAPAKGTKWTSDWQYYPLPLYDISQDPKLVQNSGY